MSKFSLSVFSVLATLALPWSAAANLTVNGTPNGTWTNNATMTYDNTATDPTSQSAGQYILNGGGSLTESSGSLTLTNTQFGVFVGQNNNGAGSNGTITMSGGTFTWNANGTSEQRFVFGNFGGSVGMLTMTGGTFNANTGAGADTSRGLTFGRQTGQGIVNLSGAAIFTSGTDRFGMGGAFGAGTFTFDTASGSITLGSGTPQFILNGLADTTAANFSINTNSGFNFTLGSGGSLRFATGDGTVAGDTAVPRSFFDGLVTSGLIKVNGAAATASQFAYAVDANNLGVYSLAVPEPSAWAYIVAGGVGCWTIAARRRRRSHAG